MPRQRAVTAFAAILSCLVALTPHAAPPDPTVRPKVALVLSGVRRHASRGDEAIAPSRHRLDKARLAGADEAVSPDLVEQSVLREHLVLPLFASLIPQMIVPYADAAALMLANLDRGNAMARHRVGLALPPGTRGHKPQGTAKSSREIT